MLPGKRQDLARFFRLACPMQGVDVAQPVFPAGWVGVQGRYEVGQPRCRTFHPARQHSHAVVGFRVLRPGAQYRQIQPFGFLQPITPVAVSGLLKDMVDIQGCCGP
jgi:hypothetical protein